MSIWKSDNWTKYVNSTYEWHRPGLRIRFQKGVNPEIRQECIEFCRWLRSKYEFPKRVVIYFKAEEFVYSQNNESVSATFFGPYDKNLEPYIRISTGDYYKLLEKYGKRYAFAAIFGSIVHELTHYFQWLKNYNLDLPKIENQAAYYKKKIVAQYMEDTKFLA